MEEENVHIKHRIVRKANQNVFDIIVPGFNVYFLIRFPIYFSKVYDGSNSTSLLLNDLRGSTVPPYILSSGTAMFFIFDTDGANTFPGYNITWSAKQRKCRHITIHNSPILVIYSNK